MEISTDSKASTGRHWAKFALLTIVLASIIYYYIYGALIYSLLIEDMRAALNLDRPFSGEKIIAGIGAFAIVWWRVQPKVTKYRDSVAVIFKSLAVFLFLFCFFIMFMPDERAVRHQTIGTPMEKVLVENGYCGEERVYVFKAGGTALQ